MGRKTTEIKRHFRVGAGTGFIAVGVGLEPLVPCCWRLLPVLHRLPWGRESLVQPAQRALSAALGPGTAVQFRVALRETRPLPPSVRSVVCSVWSCTYLLGCTVPYFVAKVPPALVVGNSVSCTCLLFSTRPVFWRQKMLWAHPVCSLPPAGIFTEHRLRVRPGSGAACARRCWGAVCFQASSGAGQGSASVLSRASARTCKYLRGPACMEVNTTRRCCSAIVTTWTVRLLHPPDTPASPPACIDLILRSSVICGFGVVHVRCHGKRSAVPTWTSLPFVS